MTRMLGNRGRDQEIEREVRAEEIRRAELAARNTDGRELRRRLIASGTIIPSAPVGRLGSWVDQLPCLRLDDAGRRAGAPATSWSRSRSEDT